MLFAGKWKKPAERVTHTSYRIRDGDTSLASTGTRTIHNDMNPLAAVYYWLFGGRFVLRYYSDCRDCAMVLDENKNTIGEAHAMRTGGWAVHTKPFSGYVPSSQIVFVE